MPRAPRAVRSDRRESPVVRSVADSKHLGTRQAKAARWHPLAQTRVQSIDCSASSYPSSWRNSCELLPKAAKKPPRKRSSPGRLIELGLRSGLHFQVPSKPGDSASRESEEEDGAARALTTQQIEDHVTLQSAGGDVGRKLLRQLKMLLLRLNLRVSIFSCLRNLIKFKALPTEVRKEVLEHLHLQHLLEGDAAPQAAPEAAPRTSPKRAPPASQEAPPRPSQKKMRRPAAATGH
ncbi:unnamed protein product [Symbiodinium sp. CCMP2592]|nr:unnamed protein product [Symbiodinium sp. CCMP2592]